MLPTDPFLLNYAPVGTGPLACPANPAGPCPFVDRDALNMLYLAGSLLRNTGTVYLDAHTRQQPCQHQVTFGYERELAPTLSVSADYIRTMGRDMLARVNNYNMPTRQGTARSDPLGFYDVFGLLGGNGHVIAADSVGAMDYDALNIQIEKRYAYRWGARLSYAYAYSRGDTWQQFESVVTQVGADLNLDELWQPAESDRRHILAVAGHERGALRPHRPRHLPRHRGPCHHRGERRRVRRRARTRFHAARRAVRLSPAAEGDADAGPVLRHLQRDEPRQLQQPAGDMRSGNFLNLLTLRVGSGFPRQAQFGIRYGF